MSAYSVTVCTSDVVPIQYCHESSRFIDTLKLVVDRLKRKYSCELRNIILFCLLAIVDVCLVNHFCVASELLYYYLLYIVIKQNKKKNCFDEMFLNILHDFVGY